MVRVHKIILGLILAGSAGGAPPCVAEAFARTQSSAPGAQESSSGASSTSNDSIETKTNVPQSHKPKSPSASVRKKRARKKPVSDSNKVVVKNGSTAEPSVQFSTAASPQQAANERQKTAGLLATTSANLQHLSGHQLNAGQEDMVTQVQSYMQQAKTAQDAGDLQGAHNLALKAQLLSSELLRNK